MNGKFALNANGTTAVASVHNGGPVYVQAGNTFGGGTLVINCSYDGGVTKTQIASLTQAGFTNFDIAPGAQLELVLSGATSPSITVIIL